jgi:hypothetical protein
MYKLETIPDGAPEKASIKGGFPFTAAIYRPDGTWVFRFKPAQLKTLASGLSEAEEIELNLNAPR